MVGTGRFELPTPRTPSECSTRLSHVPTAGDQLLFPTVVAKPVKNNGRVDSRILHQPACFRPLTWMDDPSR
jgi:hypothetical protein